MNIIVIILITGSAFINIANAQIDFNFTGTEQTYVVPVGVSGIQIEVWGAQGGGSEGFNMPNQDDGGLGGYAQGILMVTAGDELSIYVGGKPVLIPGGGNTGGFNGGGNSGQYGGAGGGASDVRLNGNGFLNRILVAGGGGGGNTGNPDFGAGGAGGGLIGADGISHRNLSEPTGGTQNTGGIGTGTASNGGFGYGGGSSSGQVAGGGGGFFGGGGGFAVGGAGGSSYLGDLLDSSTETGVRISNGLVRITVVYSNAIGSIINGNTEYKYKTIFVNGSNNFTVDGEDVLFRDWWYYRLSGDSREFAFPVPDFTTEFIGDTAILTWLDVGGRGLFSAQLIQIINQANVGGTTLSNRFLFTNLSNQAIQFDLFHYIDFDVDNFTDDEAILLSGINYISLIDNVTPNATNTAEMRAGGNLAYQVGTLNSIKPLLDDDSITALDNSGLPFAPGDFTSAFQWSEFIPASSSLFIEDSLAAGASTAPEPAQPLVFIDLIFKNGFEVN